MNRVEFIFDNASYYALYEIMQLDGVEDYYLELRDRSLISEFGLAIHFKKDNNGALQLDEGSGARKRQLLEAIVQSINSNTTK
jgi:hypothetical protein